MAFNVCVKIRANMSRGFIQFHVIFRLNNQQTRFGGIRITESVITGAKFFLYDIN